MFIIPCKYSEGSPIFECISNIKKYYPEEDIVVVDSGSNDTSYFDLIRDDVFDILEDNLNYEIGAYMKAYKAYPNEHKYYCIHDSLMINKRFDKIHSERILTTVQWFSGFWDTNDQKEYARTVIGNYVDYPFIGCFGSIMFCDGFILKRIYEFFNDKPLPTNKLESCAYERILGIFLGTYVGCNMFNSLQGRHTTIEGDYDTTYVRKVFMRRI